jgi:hypothetical protein
MGDYLEITGSMSSVLRTTQSLQDAGMAFRDEVETMVGRLEDLDLPANLPRDQFTDRLLETYTEQARENLREGARNISAWVATMAEYLRQGLHGLDDVDRDSASTVRQQEPA